MPVNRDDDLLAAMPEPPPPRPDRRKLAIEEALRRFDGAGEQAPAPRTAPPRTPVRAFLGRPPVAAFATVLLIAVLSSPVWLPGIGLQVRHPAAQPPQTAAQSSPPPVAEAPPPAEPVEARAPMPAPAADALADSRAAEASPPPPVAVAPIPGAPAAKAQGVEGRMAFAPAPSADTPSSENDTVVVTGSRIERPQTFARDVNLDRKPIIHLPPTDDAWNACTVLDPRKSPLACRDLLDPRQPGAAGRAAAFIADGLTAAWKSDLDRAIEAFDRAIATAPHGALAYLNRGLAFQLKGERDRALADFDKAIDRDPGSASAYYHRSLLLRAKGETARADADAERARQLDPQNAAVLKRPGRD